MNSIKAKLVLGAVTVSISFLLTSVGVLFVARDTAWSVLDLMRQGLGSSSELTQLGFEAQKLRRFEKEYFIYLDDPEKRKHYLDQFEKGSTKVTEHLQRMIVNRAKYYSQKEVNQFRVWQESADFYFQEFAAIDVAARTGRVATSGDANAAIKAGKDRFAVLINGLEKELAAREQLTAAGREVMAQKTGVAIIVMMGLLALLGATVALLSLHLYRNIVASLDRIADGAEEVAEGKITYAFHEEALKEFSGLAHTLEMLQRKIQSRRDARPA